MKYRKLGNTGLDVSVLSFGASSLGSVFRDTNEAEAIRTVHTAMDAGINYIDVSPYYGLTKAETVLGKAISELPRDKFLLSTKAGRYGSDQFDFSERRIFSSLEESLQRLNTDYIDIMFLHDLEFVTATQAEEAIPALQKLKQQGKIRYFGISGLPLELFEKWLPNSGIEVILSYCHYSLNDTSLLELLPLIESQKVGLVNASPLSMGLLSTRGTPDWHPAGEKLKELSMQAAQFCSDKGADIAKLAIQYATANEQIPTTLVSTANPENIRRNAEWTDEPIDEQLLSEVLAILEPVHNVTWASGAAEYNTKINHTRSSVQ